MPRLVIANIDYLVTVDPSRRIIRDGALVIQDGRIVAVGKTAELPSNPGDDVIDGRGKLALPGVFDTHVHNNSVPAPRALPIRAATSAPRPHRPSKRAVCAG